MESFVVSTRIRSFGLAALLTSVVLGGCSGAAAPATSEPPADGSSGEAERAQEHAEQGAVAPEAPASGAGSEAGDVAPEEPAQEPAEGEDGPWLVDEGGRRYREHRLPKVENFYQVSPDGTIVYLPPGLRYDLVRVEDDAIVVKSYDSAQGEERRLEATARGAQETVESRVSLEAEVGAADRLRLARFDRGLPRRGQWRQGFDVADLNGDGHLDIVHGPPRKSGNAHPVVFLGDSEGSWRRWRELRYQGPALDYGDVAVADFDGDGHLDLAFAVHLRGLLIARGDGEGGFAHWETEDLDYRVPGQGQEVPPYSTRTVVAIDWDGDGRQDLLTLSEGPRMSREGGRPQQVRGGVWGVGLYLNRGDGRWVRQEGEALPNAPFGDDLTVGDLDGDGRADFATAVHAVGSKGILNLHREDGGFEQQYFEPLPMGMATSVEAADFDGDGRTDLAVGMTTTPATASDPMLTVVALFLAREGDGWERRILAAETGQAGVWALASGDLDGDGHTDLIALTGDGLRWLFLGTGDGGFQRESSPELQPEELDCRGYAARMIDLDGDGRDEAILGFAGEAGLERQLAPSGEADGCPSGGSLEVWTSAAPASRE